MTGVRQEDTGRRTGWGRFVRHYLEMVVAMLAGMVVLGGALRAVLAVAGVDWSMATFPVLTIVEMALTMVVGMAAWMRFRGHAWPGTLEMSAAMLVPAAAVLVPVWLGVLGAGTAMAVEHVAMFVLMFLVMLRRRDEYSAAHDRRRVDGRRVGRVLGRTLVLVLAFLLLPAAVYLAGSTSYEAGRYAPPDGAAGTAAAFATPPPAHDPGKPTAVVVVGNRGANVSDALAPYHVLATTGAYNVYTVAPDRRPVPLLGGLDLVPDLDFAQLRQRLGGAAPDVTVVPEMPESDGDAAVTTWLRDTASDGLVLSVCTGARLVADAGLLGGRDATSHWYRLAGLEQRHPEVRWQRGTRYVDEGEVITTGGLLSSVDGTLRVVERMLGPAAAARAAEQVGWPGYSPGAPAPLAGSRLAPTDAVVHLLNIGFRADTTTVGVLLTDGVGELEVSSAFAAYGEVKAARTLALAPGGEPVRSRHGLVFVPRADPGSAADRVDRVVVPGRDAAARQGAGVPGVPAEVLHAGPGFAFDPVLRDMAASMDVPTARWTGKILEYPAGVADLDGPALPWGPLVRVLLLGAAGVAVALVAGRLLRRWRGRRSGRPRGGTLAS